MSKEQELPWYLRYTPFIIIAFCFAPLAYGLVLVNWNRLDDETKGGRFFVASILFLLFSIGFMPRSFLSIALSIGVFLFICALTFAVLIRRQ